MSSNIYIQSGTQYYPGLFDTEVALTIAKADQRYIKKGSDANYNVINATSRIEVESTNDTSITSSSNCDEYGLHLHSVLSSSSGIRPGCAISFNNSLSDNVPLSSICLDKITSGQGELVISTRNGVTCDERLRITDEGITVQGNINSSSLITTIANNTTTFVSAQKWTNDLATDINVHMWISSIAPIFGTSSNHPFRIMSNGTEKIRIATDGNIGIGITNPAYKLDVSGDVNITGSYRLNGDIVSFPPALAVQGALNPAGNPSSVSGYVWYTNTSRFYGARFIDSNNFCLLNVSGGTVYNDALVYTHSSNPLLELKLSNSSIKAPTLTATTEIEGPLLDLRTSQTLQTLKTRMRWGGTANDNESWFLENYTNGIDSYFNIKNTTSSLNLLGLSFGIGSGIGNSDGTMLVLNGSQGDGSVGFLNAASSSTNASLHINAGVPQSVSAGWTFDSIGQRSNSGGTVSVSLYCYNNIWVRGALYATSDKRLKNIIAPVDSDKTMRLLDIKPVWYSWKSDTENKPQLGVIAQDLLDVGLHDLTHIFKNDSVMEADEEHGLAAGEQLVVSYERIPLYMLEIIKKQQKQIEKLIELLPKTKKALFDSV